MAALIRSMLVLVALGGCQDRKLVMIPGGYTDDVLARSRGIEPEDIDDGYWSFDDIDLEIVIPGAPSIVMRTDVSGDTFGEQIVGVQFSREWPTGTPEMA